MGCENQKQNAFAKLESSLLAFRKISHLKEMLGQNARYIYNVVIIMRKQEIFLRNLISENYNNV